MFAGYFNKITGVTGYSITAVIIFTTKRSEFDDIKKCIIVYYIHLNFINLGGREADTTVNLFEDGTSSSTDTLSFDNRSRSTSETNSNSRGGDGDNISMNPVEYNRRRKGKLMVKVYVFLFSI